jgi:uncharacterized protein (TIGR00645 family)
MTKAAPERWLETGLFAARWIMAPFYVGLVAALLTLLWVFVHELFEEGSHLLTMKPDGAILMSLSLIDLSLAGNLVLIVIYSGYENFVSRIDTQADEDRPAWMGTVDFSGLKIKLIASIVAISAIALLKAFLEIADGKLDTSKLQWMVIVHMTFVMSGLFMALTDWLHTSGEGHKPEG